MGGFLLRLKNWWKAADKTQKLVTVFGGGSLIVLLIGTFLFASKPKMEILFSNLSPEDTGNIAMELEAMGIPADFDDNGNLSVPSSKRALAKANLAMKGKLPRGTGQFGTQALKEMSPFGDPKVQTEQLKSIAEGELAQSIEFFDGVDSANVQITPAVDSPFESEKKPAQANVTISEKVGGIINEDQARAMANLVASAVPGLDKTKVTIFTRTGRALWDGQDMETGSTRALNKLDMEKAEARKRRDQIQDALNRMLGAGNAIAMVDVTLDTNEKVETSRTVRPTKPLVSKSIDEGGSSGASSGGGIPSGTAANATDAPVAGSIGGGGGGATYSQAQKGVEYAADITDTTVKHGVGELKSMALTVLVNKTDKIIVNPDDPNDPVVSLANSFLGPRATDTENFSAKVVTYPFDTSQAEAAKKAEAAAASSGRMQQILSILPIAALIVVGLLVVKSIGKLAARPPTPMLAAAGGPLLSMAPDGAAALHAPAKALSAASLALPDIVKQKALEAGITEEQLHAAMEEAGEAGISLDDIPSIKAKVNVPLEQIKRMAHERPETVAMLIKSWLIEEGIRR